MKGFAGPFGAQFRGHDVLTGIRLVTPLSERYSERFEPEYPWERGSQASGRRFRKALKTSMRYWSQETLEFGVTVQESFKG